MYNVATSFLEFTSLLFSFVFLKVSHFTFSLFFYILVLIMHLCLFHKLIFLVLLVSGEEKQLALPRNEISNKMAVSEMKSVSQNEGSSAASVISINNKAVTKIKQRKHQQEPEQQQQHSLDEFFSSKRSVPNASDPLHNRWFQIRFIMLVIIINYECLINLVFIKKNSCRKSFLLFGHGFSNHDRWMLCSDIPSKIAPLV